ncbi:MAG: dihydrofolate reductase [Alphaproteobacteria bacterium]|nr:dihydrofolate reductase [Alphaproteobacteria bacterium]
MKTKTALIAAIAENGVIGTGDDMPWHIKSELMYFMRMTKGKPVIMGRKTFETLGGKPLKNRPNIIVTRDTSWHHKGVTTTHSLEDAMNTARSICAETGCDEIMVAGGAEIYKQALPFADRLYLTEIHLKPEGSITFPPFDRAGWTETKREFHKAQDGETADYTITVLEKV